MRLHLVLFVLFSQRSILSIVVAYSPSSKSYVNQNNSPVSVDLYQCETNSTRWSNDTTTQEGISSNSIDSCSVNCCKPNSSAVCQVTVRSPPNLCVGRLCYAGTCENFSSIAQLMRSPEMKRNSSTIMDTIRSSFGAMAWPTIVNTTQTKLTSWVNKATSQLRPAVLILLLVVGLVLTFATLILVMKSVRHASTTAGRRAYRYTLI